MKWNPYLLVFLTAWAHFDDVLLTPASPCQCARLPSDDDDECLPLERRTQHQEELSERRQPKSAGVKIQTADSQPLRNGVPLDQQLATHLAPRLIYIFMSLQI
jgi:hypothetical protein